MTQCVQGSAHDSYRSLRSSLFLFLLLALGACSPASGVQSVYRQGTPQLAPGFLPIGIYHALAGNHFGRLHGMAELRAAGFNTVHLWEGQDPAAAMADARANGLRVIFHNPSDSHVAAYRADAALLAWYLDEEPSMYPAAEQAERLAAFNRRAAEIRNLDPHHPIIAIDKNAIHPANRDAWLAWARAGDASAHFNYPLLANAPLTTLDTPRGIPRSVSLAARANAEQKPVFILLQAFASPHYGWRMPQPHELRAMAFAALIHGATGLMLFSYDSFVTRDGQVVGIAPQVPPDYGPTPDYDGDGRPNLVATPELAAAAEALWAAVPALNAELAALAPWILSSTSREPYSVTSSGGAVRTLLKERDGKMLLLAVNLENAPVEAEIALPGGGRAMRERFEPLEARVFHLGN